MIVLAVVLFINGGVVSYTLPHHYGYEDQCNRKAEWLSVHWRLRQRGKVMFECRDGSRSS